MATDLPLVHRSRPGAVESASPAVALVHGRGANGRDLLPIGARGPPRVERPCAAEALEAAGAEVRLEAYGVGHGTTPREIEDVVRWLEGRY